MKEVKSGIIKQAKTIDELAKMLGGDPKAFEDHGRALERAVRGWQGQRFWPSFGHHDPDRHAAVLRRGDLARCSNTQGGPVHDGQQRIIDVFGDPIPNLYSAGEMGSGFGHLYLSGGNIAECFITGRIAGKNAARGT